VFIAKHELHIFSRLSKKLTTKFNPFPNCSASKSTKFRF